MIYLNDVANMCVCMYVCINMQSLLILFLLVNVFTVFYLLGFWCLL